MRVCGQLGLSVCVCVCNQLCLSVCVCNQLGLCVCVCERERSVMFCVLLREEEEDQQLDIMMKNLGELTSWSNLPRF